MGKHERGWVEATEKLTAQIANGDDPDDDLSDAGRLDLAEALADRLRSDFPDVTAVRHAGNSYDSLGDLIVETPDSETFVEAKFVAGGGTRANLGQDTLTQFELFEDATAWSDFREAIGFPEDREALLPEVAFGDVPRRPDECDDLAVLDHRGEFRVPVPGVAVDLQSLLVLDRFARFDTLPVML